MREADRLRDAVWSSWRQLQRPVEEAAAEVDADVYLVGGYVRDLLLGRQPTDLDLTVEGDGLAFAERLGDSVAGVLRSSGRFLTAAVRLTDGRTIDVTTARSEVYPQPGSLPRVEPASISADLKRRDFTVNTFALGLAGGAVGALLAGSGARDDLQRRLLRVLHPGSFLDDPTRVLRAVRLELQLGFRLATASERQAREALASGAFDTVSGERLWNDLRPLLAEPELAPPACRRLQELGALATITGGLGWSAKQERVLVDGLRKAVVPATEADGGVRDESLVAVLLALSSGTGGYVGAELADRLSVPRELREALVRWPRKLSGARELFAGEELSAGAVHAALKALSAGELLLLAGSVGSEGEEWIRREVAEFRRLRLAIGARDLLAAGWSPGPQIGRVLDEVLAARLDGLIGPGEELDYALRSLEAMQSTREESDESE